MITVFLNDDILQEKISVFFKFAKDISDSFTVCREFGGKLPKETFNKVNSELKSEINKEDIARREKFKKDEKYGRELKQVMGIATKKQVLKYFDDVKKDDIKAVTASRTLTDDKPFITEAEDHIETFYSKQSAVKRGPVFELVRYRSEGETFKAITGGLKDAFHAPYVLENTEFEDIAFYKEGELKIGLNCKDRYCIMQLTREELGTLVQLKITHELM